MYVALISLPMTSPSIVPGTAAIVTPRRTPLPKASRLGLVGFVSICALPLPSIYTTLVGLVSNV